MSSRTSNVVAVKPAVKRQRGGECFHLGQTRRLESAPEEIARPARSGPLDAFAHYRPNFIKVDIEGGETAMLSGARDLLIRSHPILLIELHGTNAAVDAILREVRYRTFVVGDSRSILDAPWSAFIIGVPEENETLCHQASSLTKSAALER